VNRLSPRFGDLANDAVIAVSASGSTPFTVGRRGRGTPSRRLCDRHRASPGFAFTVPAPDAPIFLDSGEEALRGSTRLAAGTAQKAALGMLSSLMGFELGHVHQGLMVNLKADNAKIARRALGIVAMIAGVFFQRGQGERRASRDRRRGQTGDPDARGGVSMSEAVARLTATDGRIDDALRPVRAPRGE